MNKIKTVSVAIPVFDESENISFLLRSIVNQKQVSYKLENIFIICDGSTDGTDMIAKKISAKNPMVKVITHKNRKGKKQRLKEMYAINNSDILITCDGDIVLSNPHVLANIVKKFSTKKIAVVSGNNQPFASESFFGNVQSIWFKIWYEARKDFKKGNNVNNIRGCVLALTKDFSKQVEFTNQIISDAQYIYFLALKKNLNFEFAKDAIILYRIPDNIKDYLLQKTRSSNDKQKIAEEFGVWIYDEYKIPFKFKIMALIKSIVKYPIMTSLVIFFHTMLIVFPYKRFVRKNNILWRGSKSTKKGIDNITF